MIYYLENIDTVEEQDVRELLPFLSEERREILSRYRFAKSRGQCALAYLLLRYGLIRDYGVLSQPTWGAEEGGKPFLQNMPHIHFNISHCDKAVACGFGSAPLGIDVQHIVPYKESLAKFFMTPEEQVQCLSGDKDRQFTRLWTLKEAYGKCHGFGIGYSMSKLPLEEGKIEKGHILQSHHMETFYLSVCSQEAQQLQKLTLTQLKTFFLSQPQEST